MRYRSALEEIVRVGTTPDTTITGFRPDGTAGHLWSEDGPEKALAAIVDIASAALDAAAGDE